MKYEDTTGNFREYCELKRLEFENQKSQAGYLEDRSADANRQAESIAGLAAVAATVALTAGIVQYSLAKVGVDTSSMPPLVGIASGIMLITSSIAGACLISSKLDHDKAEKLSHQASLNMDALRAYIGKHLDPADVDRVVSGVDHKAEGGIMPANPISFTLNQERLDGVKPDTGRLKYQ